MPSIKCRACKIAKQSAFIEQVDAENEKPVLHVRYCALIFVLSLIVMVI